MPQNLLKLASDAAAHPPRRWIVSGAFCRAVALCFFGGKTSLETTAQLGQSLEDKHSLETPDYQTQISSSMGKLQVVRQLATADPHHLSASHPLCCRSVAQLAPAQPQPLEHAPCINLL